MNNLQILKMLFSEVLTINVNDVKNDLTYQSIQQWDSVGHMALITAIESRFDIMMDTDDIIDLSSFEKAVEIIKKYGTSFDA